MIINFSVENFGSIKEKQTLSFLANKSDHLEDYYIIEPIKGLRLNKLALIYGANASGKTTVLKALDFLREICTDPFDKKTEKFDFEPFLFDESTPNQNTKFELEFVQNGIRYFYEVELNKKCIVNEKLYNFNPNKALIFERRTNEENEVTQIEIGTKYKNRRSLQKNLGIHTLWNNTVFGGFLKANINFIELKLVSDWFNIDLYNALLTTLTPRSTITDFIEKKIINKNLILKILKKADFNISNIVINNVKKRVPKALVENSDFLIPTENGVKMEFLEYSFKEILFTHNINNKTYNLSLEKESDGTKRFYDLSGILGLLVFTICILPIDELESSIHPDLFQHFLLTFLVNSKNSQLIATTHNREILNNRDIFRDDAIWFTDKNEDSATELYSLADFDSSVVRDTTNVLNAYKSGKLGGVPNLGDYYINLDEE